MNAQATGSSYIVEDKKKKKKLVIITLAQVREEGFLHLLQLSIPCVCT
jgi:hypothetical protein